MGLKNTQEVVSSNGRLISGRSTRQSNDIQIPKWRITTGQRSFTYRAIKIWNTLCSSLKQSASIDDWESLGEFESFCELELQARVYTGTFKFDQTLSSIRSGYLNTFRWIRPSILIFLSVYKFTEEHDGCKYNKAEPVHEIDVNGKHLWPFVVLQKVCTVLDMNTIFHWVGLLRADLYYLFNLDVRIQCIVQ